MRIFVPNEAYRMQLFLILAMDSSILRPNFTNR